MTNQSGGGGGLSGVTSDGLTPGGEIIAGALTAGDPTAATVPSMSTVYGSVVLRDTVANVVDGDDVLAILQQHAIPSDGFGTRAVQIIRNGSTAQSDYAFPAVSIIDGTLSAQALQEWVKNGVTQFQVDADGVQVHGKFKTGAAVAHVLGAYSGNTVPIYDEAGTLLGYMPLYA